MTDSEFWELIEEARGSVQRIADLPIELETRLSGRPVEDIIDFEVIFWRFMNASYDGYLWLTAAVICGGCGDDGFDYFRCWLIAQGRSVFERALENPDSLAELQSFEGNDELPELEKMLYVARFAYQKKTGRDEVEKVLPPYTRPTLKRPEIWDGQKSSVPRLLPNLAQRFHVV